MRIRGAETEMEQLGLDTEGMVGSTAKLQKELLALTGVDIMKDKNTFKSTYDFLDELSSIHLFFGFFPVFSSIIYCPPASPH